MLKSFTIEVINLPGGERGSWTAAATGPRPGAAAGRSPSPEAPEGRAGFGIGAGAGTHAGGAAAGQRGPTRGREDLALPSAPGRRRRRHFAFHSV